MGRRTFSELGVLGLYTESPLHCGAESGSGYVDLPVQRERHTHYPLIPGTTLKGVLRDEMLGHGGLTQDDIRALFGTEDASGPGQVAFGDGSIAAFPVRSSDAPFHWVTCPFVLERVLRSLGREALEGSPAEGEAWAREGSEKGPVLLEEIALERMARPELFDPDDEASVVSALLELLPSDERGFGYTRKIFPDRLLILRDEDFAELVEVGTEAVTRIKLNFLGTTANLERKEYPKEDYPELEEEDLQGNLFVQELVPPETLFFAPLRAKAEEAERFRGPVAGLEVIRIGGDETVGRGLTHTCWVPRADRGKEA